MANYSCNTSDNVYFLNQICSKGFDIGHNECTKDYGRVTDVAGIISGTWHICIGIIGIFGNIITLIAIPYAAERKRHEIEKNYNTTTVFLLHLSFIDLLHCVFMAIPRGAMYLGNRSPFGEYSCQIIMYAGMTIFVADMLALAFVAISRCFDMVFTHGWTRFCSEKKNLIFLFFLVWIPSLLTIPTLLVLHSYGIEIGWNCELGGCGFVRNCSTLDDLNVTTPAESDSQICNVRMEVWRIIYIIIFCIPTIALLMIICSYLLIWYKTHMSTKTFLGTQETYRRLYGREMRMTRTISILIVLNVMFWFVAFAIVAFKYDKSLSSAWMPMTIQKYVPYITFVNIFEIQYALNFFVYMARRDRYREAFLNIFKDFHRSARSSFRSDERRTMTR
jgi:hypothetical protein